MANHHHHGTSETEYRTHLTIEDGTSLCTCLSLDVNTLIIKSDIMQSLHVILTEMTDNTIGTSYRHRQTTTVALKITTETTILRTHRIIKCLRVLLSLSNLLGMLTSLCLRTTLCGKTSSLSLLRLTLSLLTGFLITGGTCLSLRLFLTSLGFRDTTGILPCRCFCRCFLTGKLSSTLLSSLCLRFPLRLCSSTGFLACHLLCDQTVDLCV